tara:strand:+ start:788 stop:994 length:207 start_codon:yes stop_codon:yes gene_type:complete
LYGFIFLLSLTLAHSNRFDFQVLVVSYSTFHQMWEVITKKNDIEVSYRWFASRKKAEAFAFQLKPSCS